MDQTTHMRHIQPSTLGRFLLKLWDRLQEGTRISLDQDPAALAWQQSIDLMKQTPNAHVLEIGSRKVSGGIRRDLFAENQAKYIGFDILEGENVDVVGDVHRLSELLPAAAFDIVFSASVFEHLMFPWKAALEINQVLKIGGYCLVATHPCWPEHEMPWDFWRFPHSAFKAMFNTVTGFEIEVLAEGKPMRAFSLVKDPSMRKFYQHSLNGQVICLARKVGDYDKDRLKWDIVPSDIVDTLYPALSD